MKHGSAILKEQKQLSIDDMLSLNHRMMGGGMSQTYSALYFLEYYIRDHEFSLVIEIGTQKGALSLYLANMAAVTEQFHFITVDITDKDYRSRPDEGVGHWLDKLEEICPDHIEVITDDCFSPHFTDMLSIGIKNDEKVLIFCDGGDKKRELDVFGGIIKTSDHILVHDWGMELYHHEVAGIVKSHNLEIVEPYYNWGVELRTLMCPFKKI